MLKTLTQDSVFTDLQNTAGWDTTEGGKDQSQMQSNLYLSTAAHSELLEGADVINKQVHQPESVWKPHKDEEACGM